ncbi:MAG TPA: hypothetical protein VFR67_00115 [Pilimelia sp.]|nr:hypothetical protein [Pilimelia sp.]
MRTSVEDQRHAPTRRAVLRAAGAGAASLIGYALSGCDLFTDRTSPPPAPDPLAPLLAETVELIGRYDAALAAHPALSDRLVPVREAHLAHATAIARLIGAPAPGGSPGTGTPSPSGSGTGAPADEKSTLAALRAAEQAGQRRAAQACLAAPAGRAALLGSVAAARATHAEVLR